jgi:hypothetical protein
MLLKNVVPVLDQWFLARNYSVKTPRFFDLSEVSLVEKTSQRLFFRRFRVPRSPMGAHRGMEIQPISRII